MAEPAFLSDVFHELSQPLTALHCLLELSLQRDRTADELRATVEKALDNADRLRQRLMLMRAIYYAAELDFAGDTADLNDLVREIQEDLFPVFASAGQELRAVPLPVAIPVKGDRRQLHTALFSCLEYLLRYSEAPAVTRVEASVARKDHFGEIHIHSLASLPMSLPGAERRTANSFELELACRTFRAAGGDFSIVRNNSSGIVCRGRLPLA